MVKRPSGDAEGGMPVSAAKVQAELHNLRELSGLDFLGKTEINSI